LGTPCSSGICQNGQCIRGCAGESLVPFCFGRCGTWEDACVGPVTCPTCPSGQRCLTNRTCARACTVGGTECAGCASTGTVTCSDPTTEGERNCQVAPTTPASCETLQACGSTVECPFGSQCQGCGTSVTNRCIPVAFSCPT
jgi:hypothetical protein